MPETPATNSEETYPKVKTSDFIKMSWWAITFWFKLDPFRATVLSIVTILTHFQGLGYSYIFAKVVDNAIRVASSPSAHLSNLYPFIAAILAFSLFNALLGMIDARVDRTLSILNRTRLRQALYRKLHYLGIQTLENPTINDQIHRSNDYLPRLGSFVEQILGLLGQVAQLIGTLIISISIVPIFVPIALLLSVPFFIIDKNLRVKLYKFDYETTEDVRRAQHAAGAISDTRSLEEVYVTSSFTFLDRKYADYKNWVDKIQVGLFSQWQTSNYFFDVMRALVSTFAYLQLFGKLISKHITVGSLTFYISTLTSFQSGVTRVMGSFTNLFETSLRFKDVYSIFTCSPLTPDGTIPLAILTEGPEVFLDNITFTYPNSKNPVIQNLSLKIKSGEKLAVVGPNGAGKTTIVKLISRFYKPQEGAIYINGQNISVITSMSLFENIGVLSQEYNKYPFLSARENIYIGRPNQPLDEVGIRLAAQAAEALEFIEEYPNKFDQVLSEKIKKGIRPSTGQWQKLAIARFFYRNAPLVIFDEPTSSIDATSEYNIFNKIYEFFKGKTVIIISHRFSTVRNADRIIVLDKGKIVEEGSHNQLMDLNGTYAKSFLLQAQGYTTTIV